MKADSGRAAGRGCLTAFFGLFALAGLLTSSFFIRAALQIFEARSWPEVSCVVKSSAVGRHSDSKSTTYSVDIVYEYEVAGRTYSSSSYGFLGGSSSGYQAKADVVEMNPAGTRRTCFVDPADPSRAVLTRSFSGEFFFVLIPLVFVAAGLGGIVFAWRFDPATRAGSGSRGRRQTMPAPATLSSGPVVLGAPGPVARFVGFLLIALFWNGLVSVFLWQVLGDWRRGNRQVGAALFLVPFVLIGLALVGGVGYAFLALFNPRLRATLSSGAIPAGGAALLQWTFTSGGAGITRLTITLEGAEETRVRSGRSTSTNRAVFATVPVWDAPDATDLSSGSVTVSIPRDARPSSPPDLSGTRVVWKLKFAGEIPRWPDVSEEYEIGVAPAST